MTSKRDEMSF